MSLAIQFDDYGDAEVLHLVEVEPPAPGPGQVRLRVAAAAVNGFDLKLRSGAMREFVPLPLPASLGLDVAGTVDAVGEGASARVGDEVFGTATSGGYAQYAVADVVAEKPAAMSWPVAAALSVAAETAGRVLTLTGVTANDTVLVLGAAGSVGLMTAQFARDRGATVLGTARSADLDELAKLGIRAVEYGDGWADRVRTIAAAGVDVVIDTVGRGLLGDAVALAGGPQRVITIADNDAGDHGVRFTGGGEGSDPAKAYAAAIRLFDAGRLRVDVGEQLPLADAARAHEIVASGNAHGKVILLP